MHQLLKAETGQKQRRRLPWLWRWLLLLLCMLGIGLVIFAAWPWPAGYPLKSEYNSTLIYDNSGHLLREAYLQGGSSQHWVKLADIPVWVQEAVLTAEDRRFYYHPGFDPAAIIRSAYYNVKAGHVLMGGSTIPEQLIRILMPARPRTLKSKIIELIYALRLSMNFSKAEILEAYLNRAYFGCHSYGIEAAARFYFNCSSHMLSPAQGAFLAVLIRAPKDLANYKNFEVTEKLAHQLLQAMHESGRLTQEELNLALQEKLELAPLSERFAAPHFCDYVLDCLEKQGLMSASKVRTSLDSELQAEAEKLLNYHLDHLYKKNVHNGGLVVLEARSGHILAMVGSRNYWQEHEGQNNAALALRQPGSTLKPFTYALALERGFTAASVLPDLEYLDSFMIDSFVPQNYDRRAHGPVRLREALACSYNIPAVYALQKVGVDRLLGTLHKLGFSELTHTAKHYGLGLTMGAGEVSLLHLANAYRAFANGGRYTPSEWLLEVDGKPALQAVDKNTGSAKIEGAASGVGATVGDLENSNCGKSSPSEDAVFSASTCALIGDILSDNISRARSFGLNSVLNLPFWCAAKTGTSKDFRDNWCVGYTSKYVVAVWVGNFNASPMHNVSGITGAAPLFRDLMLYLYKRDHRLTRSVKAVDTPDSLIEDDSRLRILDYFKRAEICPQSGLKPGPYCPGKIKEYFLPQSLPQETCTWHDLYCFAKTGNQETYVPICPVNYPKSAYYTKVCCVYPPLYHAWMRQNQLPIPPDWAKYRPEPSISQLSSRTKAASKHTSSSKAPSKPVHPQIFYPEDGAAFCLDPFLRTENQKIVFKALAPEKDQELLWKMDGHSLGTTKPPHTVTWVLTPGQHKITLHDAKTSVLYDSLNLYVQKTTEPSHP